VLLLDVPMAGEAPSEWTQITSLLLWANGGGETHPFEAYRAWLEDAGFGSIRSASERWLAADA
jgi:hypothetical protein